MFWNRSKPVDTQMLTAKPVEQRMAPRGWNGNVSLIHVNQER